ncbi:hypothetical protein [Vibrio metschnikovii]|uniref:hypothetical protein n=1 Tax=Vibrio TaxID=662 RepID=UPI002FCB2667
MIKYLYGKKQYLTPLLEGSCGFRYSDLSHYARLENELMRDDEMSKTFLIDKNSGVLKINDRIIDPDAMTSDPEISIPTRHCFCLCLSSRKDSGELYEKFKADICIEVNVALLEEFLIDLFAKRLKGMKVIGRDITYYEKYELPKTFDPVHLTFHKPSAFKHEAEYRVALFYPLGKSSFQSANGELVPFMKDDESMHLTISYPEKDFLKQFIGKVYEPKIA